MYRDLSLLRNSNTNQNKMLGSNPMSSSNPKYSIPPLLTTHLITTTAASFRVGQTIQRRLNLGLLLNSSIKSLSRLGGVPRLKDICHEKAIQFAGFSFQWPINALSGTLMGFSFFNGRGNNNIGKSLSRASRGDLFDSRRQWTNILLAANVLVYIAQTVSDGNVIYWGAKVNSLIREGQLWRLVTSAFLHANIGHLMINCYSLNSVGPAIENVCGSKRYLTIYIASAIASSAMSYWFCRAPAVGASGAIFGLVGSFAMFVLRHRGIVKDTESDLKHIAQVIVLNMGIGMLSRGIDNWGHFGGLIGGAAVSWLVGPAWEVERITRDGRKVLTDKAPIFSLIKRHPK